MRSIGAWKIKKLKAIVKEEMEKTRCVTTFSPNIDVASKVKARIPSDWYETWECAWSEINRLVDDFINEYKYKR